MPSLKPISISFLGSRLIENKSEILKSWRDRLNIAEEFLLFRMSDNVQATLNNLFLEVLSFLNKSRLIIPQFPSNPLPDNATRNEAHILLLGEEAFVEVLRKTLKVSDEEWLQIRRILNDAFHQAVIANSSASCDACHMALSEKLAESGNLCGELNEMSQNIRS